MLVLTRIGVDFNLQGRPFAVNSRLEFRLEKRLDTISGEVGVLEHWSTDLVRADSLHGTEWPTSSWGPSRRKKYEMIEDLSTCLAALYLRGLPRPAPLVRRRWPKVASVLRQHNTGLAGAAELLRKHGLWEEAVALDTPVLIEAASAEVTSGRVLTSVDDGYPIRWLERLADGAPPALWISGSVSKTRYIGIVGSRQVDDVTRRFAAAIGSEAVELGFGVVSGGAIGCDQAGAQGGLTAGGVVVEILPHGIDLYRTQDRCGLAVCPPHEEFTRANAMERNTLIYAASEQTVVVHARFKEGGTWIGAAEANRRRLCQLIVRDDGSPGNRALISLGGTGIEHPEQLGQALERTPPQPGLFHIG